VPERPREVVLDDAILHAPNEKPSHNLRSLFRSLKKTLSRVRDVFMREGFGVKYVRSSLLMANGAIPPIEFDPVVRHWEE
jgi:hypothetical protein